MRVKHMPHQLDGAFARVNRAAKHITELKSIVDIFGKLVLSDLCWKLMARSRSDEDTGSGSEVNRPVSEFLV